METPAREKTNWSMASCSVALTASAEKRLAAALFEPKRAPETLGTLRLSRAFVHFGVLLGLCDDCRSWLGRPFELH